ncbi:MAG TPA: LytTR family DNA-binding domain-containing protein [Vicinamibacteria bacterium]|nr:LytTR family DNA-binding domain-containing protein [Vicinamibacteria bacterium]
MTLRALVVDDEELARQELCFLLESIPAVDVVGQAGNGIEAVGLIEELSPDLLFLDIQMPGLDGFQVVRRLVDLPAPPHLIFVTAYDQYAIKAFEVNAVDYLLKPVEKSRLKEAVSRAAKKKREGLPIQDQLERLLGALERGTRQRRLVVKAGERYMLVDDSDIVYASVEDGVVTVVTDHVTGTSNARTLEELSASLDPNVFWRVHRSYIVNLERIREVIPWFNRTIQLKMTDRAGTEIPVSRSHTRRLKEHLNL